MEGYYEFCITKYVFEGIIDIQDVSCLIPSCLLGLAYAFLK